MFDNNATTQHVMFLSLCLFKKIFSILMLGIFHFYLLCFIFPLLMDLWRFCPITMSSLTIFACCALDSKTNYSYLCLFSPYSRRYCFSIEIILSFNKHTRKQVERFRDRLIKVGTNLFKLRGELGIRENPQIPH